MNTAKMNGVANGVDNGYTNHHTNGYTNGYTNGHTHDEHKYKNGHTRPRDDMKTEISDQNTFTYEVVEEIAKFLQARTSIRPKIGIICGSGLSPLAETLTEKKCFPYHIIPHFPESTVKGHAGQLVFGKLNGVSVVCMQGRFHYYEGYPLWKCCMPVRVMKLVGVTHLIATNAAGGLKEGYKVGDIMILKDHINMMGFAGNNPLTGANDERFGPRFPSMNKAYDTDLIKIAKDVAQEMGVGEIVHEGVYTCLGGPCFETIAELKLLRILGVDAVGMSTVHEVITAVHCGMKVFAFSLITNECVMDYASSEEANHEEVMDTAKMRTPVLQELVSELVKRMSQQPQLCKCLGKVDVP